MVSRVIVFSTESCHDNMLVLIDSLTFFCGRFDGGTGDPWRVLRVQSPALRRFDVLPEPQEGKTRTLHLNSCKVFVAELHIYNFCRLIGANR